MSIPTQQNALVLTERLEALTLSSDFSVPAPWKDEVLVKIHASALNPVDWKIAKLGFPTLNEYPTVLGSDIAGEIVQLGDGVLEAGKFKVRDRILFQGLRGDNRYAGFVQYTPADVFTLSKIPSNVSYEEASTLPVALTTAALGLYNSRPHGLNFKLPTAKAQEKSTLVHPSSSSGEPALWGNHPAGQNLWLQPHYYHSLFEARLLPQISWGNPRRRSQLPIHKDPDPEITSAPIRAVFDAISEDDTQAQALDVLEADGQVVFLLPSQPEIVERAKKENIAINAVFAMKLEPQNKPLLRELWPHVEGLLAAGDLKPNRVEIVLDGLNGIVSGLNRLEGNKVSGVKLVVRPQED